MRFNKIVFRYRYDSIVYCAAQAIAGVAILQGNLALYLGAMVISFGWLRWSLLRRLPLLFTVLVGNTIYMMTVMSWFRQIDALGWQKIGGVQPQAWLMGAVFLASLVCSIVIIGIWKLTIHAYFSASRTKSPLYMIYVWSCLMAVTEITRVLIFSLLCHHSQAPIEPSLNLFSPGPLIDSTVLQPFSRTMGFWGSSFIIYALAGFIFEVSAVLVARKYLIRRIVFQLTVFIFVAGLVYASSATTIDSDKDTDTIHVVAVSQKPGETDYLKDLAQRLAITDSSKTIVVLPEYSNLLHPFRSASLATPVYDSLTEYPELFKDKDIYFVGTEDELVHKGRYVETYVTDGSLAKVKRSVKTFLIPGGEYVVPWVGAVIKQVEPGAVINFSASQSRKVFEADLSVQHNDTFANDIGIGACSTILTPFHFRKQVSQGASVLAINVSFEQFTYAPEYERFAHRFARFTAYSTNRPIAFGARSGDASIYTSSGKLEATSRGNLTAEAHVVANHGKTIYVLLGDTLIISLLFAPLGTLGLFRFRKKFIP